jgi:hypothetical protein
MDIIYKGGIFLDKKLSRGSVRLLFPSPGSQATKEEEDLSPYCGRKLQKTEADSRTFPEISCPPQEFRK